MSTEIPVPENEIFEVLEWSKTAIDADATDFEEGTYEAGVHDAIRWMLGEIKSRPGEV